MTKSQMAEDTVLRIAGPSGSLGAGKRAMGEIILGIKFRSKGRERIYDADKIWSGEHTILDCTEI